MREWFDTMAEQPIDRATSDRARDMLRRMYDAAVACAHPDRCLAEHLPAVPERGRLLIVGAGKAGAAMAVAAGRHYAASGAAGRVSGTVVTRHGFALPSPHIAVTEAGHPVPDAAGVAAAGQALEIARNAGSDDIVLCLLSGGASALWSAPLPGISLADKQRLTKDLLRAGARIDEINCVRKHLSAIKGGRLAAAAWPARLVTLAISDVPRDDPAVIGSGPTVADPTTLADARAVLTRFAINPPPAIAAALADARNETIKPGARELEAATYTLVATPKASLEAAAAIARQTGYRVSMLGDALEGEARDIATAHARMAREARARGERVAILSGGELTVTVRGNGAGGPNQEYMLSLAIALQGAAGIHALAADTDGIDGGGGDAADPAGAIVTPDTLERAAARDLIPAQFLADNNSTAFFAALGDLVRCGPTQTNVNDFRVILIDP